MKNQSVQMCSVDTAQTTGDKSLLEILLVNCFGFMVIYIKIYYFITVSMMNV